MEKNEFEQIIITVLGWWKQGEIFNKVEKWLYGAIWNKFKRYRRIEKLYI